ncbi:MAG TPA: DUF4389 domain-containing protein [Marmoricola sp.]|nr:DUF4389 domain-containing protein [Marmoricola sp.]
MTQAGWYPHPETGAWWWWDGTQWLAEAPAGAPPRPPLLAAPPVPVPSDDEPVQFSVDYPDRPLSRWTTAFRLILAIPILILLGLVAGDTFSQASSKSQGITISAGAAGLLVLPPLLMILFRRKYPRWWFDWNLELLRFSNRVEAYMSLMDDRYPSTDEHQSVHLDIAYPNAATDLNRWLPLVKWLLAIPHFIVLIFLTIGAFFAVIIAWFAIIITARYPRPLFNYVEGVMRWNNRVTAYAIMMATDKYPPFRLSA